MKPIALPTLHPDDLLFFTEVTDCMKQVARRYNLPLKSIDALPMPKAGMADRMGQCSHDGVIHIVMRCTVDGLWCAEPLSPDEIWETAAHELAHLRVWNHGLAHDEFTGELLQALRNRQEDHKARVIKKLVKLQASRQGEAEIGNAAAAEAFAQMINKMLIEYELQPSDIDYAAATDNDPVIEFPVDLPKYHIAQKKTRIAWQEALARIVADAHLCSFLLRPGSNDIWFVGTRSHALVAEYVFGTLLPTAEKLCHAEFQLFYTRARMAGDLKRTHGFKESWLGAFIMRIQERFRQARAEALRAAESHETALIRLDGALVKTKKYINDKFKAKKRRTAAVKAIHISNRAAMDMGRAAADRMVLGRRGVTGGASQKQIGE